MMGTIGGYRRLLMGLAGVALVAVGLSGLSWTWQSTAVSAQPADGGSHETMHEMMDAIHGEGTAARMHEVDGAEEMMETCGSMRGGGMPDMGPIMRGGGMSNMGWMMGSG